MSCWGSHLESFTLSGKPSMVSVSHFQSIFCLSLLNTDRKAFLLSSDIREDFKIDLLNKSYSITNEQCKNAYPNETKITPFFASSIKVCRSGGSGFDSLQFIIPTVTQLWETGLSPLAIGGWPKVRAREAFFSILSKDDLCSPGNFLSKRASHFPSSQPFLECQHNLLHVYKNIYLKRCSA